MSEKKTCLFCGEEIKESDDVVECLYCEGLYHKECRENIPGCVVPGCYASDEKVNLEALENLEEKEEKRVYSGREASAFFSDNRDYYDKEFTKIRNGKILSWNWAAFFLSDLWLFYRKMYFVAIPFMLVSLAVDVFSAAFPELEGMLSILDVLSGVILGFTANHIYYARINKLCSRAEDLRGEERSAFISKKGGSSVASAIIYLVVFALISAAVSSFAEVIFSGF